MSARAQRIQELTALAAGSDLSLATRRLMDVCDEYPDLGDLRPLAMQVRADYNLGRELGASELTGESAHTMAQRVRALVGTIQERSAGSTTAESSAPTELVFASHDITKRFSSGGHRFALGPLQVELRTGEITGVVGENGNGKTTLLRQIAGLLDHDAGTLSYPQAPTTPYGRRASIAWIPQRSQRWYGTLLQNLRFTAAVHGITGADNEDRVLYTLHRLGLTRFKDLTWNQLSSGYKLRFELARMVVWHPRILVLDEPIANLDLQAQQLFLQDLRHLASSQRHPVSVILSSQQLHEIEAVADRIIFLKDGKPVYNGPTKGFDHERSSNVFEIKLHSAEANTTADRTRLVAVLGETNISSIDDTGLILRLTTPRHVTSKEVLKALAQADVELNYFRDISTSTRKLFHQDT